MGLLILASEYAAASVERMVREAAIDDPALKDLTENYVDLVFGLEVGFIFPNVPAGDRELLVAIMKVRNSIAVLLNGVRPWRTDPERREHERLATSLKMEFLRLRSQIILSGLEKRLDRVQRQVFLDEFLSITLDKESSTTLFFRAEPEAISASPLGAVAPPPPVRVPPPVAREERVRVPGPPQASAPRAAVDPWSDPAPAQAARPVRAPSSAPLKKVLVIDNDTQATEVVRYWLYEGGYEVLVAHDTLEGYVLASAQRPDLVLLDLSAPSPDPCRHFTPEGPPALRMLSLLSGARGLPVIVLSKANSSALKPQALAAGAVACLQKPLDQRRLLGAIDIALDDSVERAETVSAPRSVVSICA